MAKDETTRFISKLDLAFKAGEYTITVAHELKDKSGRTGIHETPISEFKLLVAGERFRLSEGDIQAVSPGRERVGRFGFRLPHIVLQKADLPWQRLVGGGASGDAPWLALLVFHDSDPAPESKEIPLKELNELPEEIFHPKVSFSARDHPDKDRCRAIDVPVATFNAIAPRLDELPLLAHVREVSLRNKSLERHGIAPARWEDSRLLRRAGPTGRRAVIVANRLCEAGTSRSDDTEGELNTIHLVSLESFGPYLPKEDRSSILPKSAKSVRLVTLTSWKCYSLRAKKHSLREVCTHLDAGSLSIPMPRRRGTIETVEDRRVRGALSLGYTALNHNTRTDDRTVSWYRGPLAPHPVERKKRSIVKSADAGLRYDPEETGMFDVSYAAAWQLGRLLALRDDAFSQSLKTWRQECIRQTRETLEETRWREEMGLPPADNEPGSSSEAFVKSLADGLQECLDAAPEADLDAAAPRPPSDSHAFVGTLIDTMSSPGRVKSLNAVSPPAAALQEESIGEWLGALKLLHGVPFHYLLPDPRLLPERSVGALRLFHVDANWIHHLVQGAMSIGRDSRVDLAHEEVYGAKLDRDANVSALGLRSRLLGRVSNAPAAADDEPSMSGCLLRSSLLADWPGLELIAYDENDRRLGLRRMEPLSNTVLLAIFEGSIRKLVFQEPSEELYFGLNEASKKRPRDTQGRQLPASVPASYRDGKLPHVLDVCKLAVDMAGALPSGDKHKPSGGLFGLQMIESGDWIAFEWKRK